MQVPKIWIDRLSPVLALLAPHPETKFAWRDPGALGGAVEACLSRPGTPQAGAVETLARLAIGLAELGAKVASAELLAVLQVFAPDILRRAAEQKKSATPNVTGHRVHAAAIDHAPGRARGNALLHQRRWTDLERRRATARRRPARA